MSWNGESQQRVVKMKQGVPWPISLCKLETGNSSTQIETGAHLRAAVIAKNTKIELVCNLFGV